VRAWLLAVLLLLPGCEASSRYAQAVCVLVDVSGTYADQRAEVVRLLKREVLPRLEPGDTLMVIRIDSQSYEEANLETLVRLDARPSQANAQKLALARRLDAFAASAGSSRHSDIPGALMLAADYLRELESGSRVILLFSDLREELPSGTRRSLGEGEFAGMRVVATHVKRLHDDGLDPAVFRARLAHWQERVERAGAVDWRTLMDPAGLPDYLDEARRS
jgi:hypothetical protein